MKRLVLIAYQVSNHHKSIVGGDTMFVIPVRSRNNGKSISPPFCLVAIHRSRVYLIHRDPHTGNTETISWKDLKYQVDRAIRQHRL